MKEDSIPEVVRRETLRPWGIVGDDILKLQYEFPLPMMNGSVVTE